MVTPTTDPADNGGMSASVHFSIKYDGPALANHQMDVRELAPALLALAALLEESNKVAFPDAEAVRVHINGTFRAGSFGVDLIALQSVKNQIISMFSGPEASSAANLLGILSALGLLGSGGVIGIVRWLAGRKPSSIKPVGENIVITIASAGKEETMTVDLVAGKLFSNKVVRQSLVKIVAPLQAEGIDFFACGKDGEAQAVITKAEAPWFDAAGADYEVVSDTVSHAVLLQIESAVFKDGNKWRFNDGTVAFFAEIQDENFLARVDSGQERFGKGDVLLVDLQRIQSITENGLKMDNVVTRVVEHRAPLQAPFSFN